MKPPQHDLNYWTNEQLVKEGYRLRAILSKRKKRLEELIAKNPGEYSPYGLRALTDTYDDLGNLKTGIPKVSVNQHRGTLKANVAKLRELVDMKTTTARGAKADVNEKIRLILNVPTKGRLNAQQTRDFKSAKQFFKDNPEKLSEFFTAFEYYQDLMRASMMGSERELKQFSEFFLDRMMTGYQQVQDTFSEIEKLANKHYLEEQRKAQLIPKQRRTGGFA